MRTVVQVRARWLGPTRQFLVPIRSDLAKPAQLVGQGLSYTRSLGLSLL
jgi:hypothetical protein